MRERATSTALLLFVTACVLLTTARFAHAADDVATELRQVLAESGEAGAENFLAGILAGYESGGDTDRALDAADAALAVLPSEVGRAHAADLVATVLERERGQPRAWRDAFRLRDRLHAALDAGTGERFLDRLSAAYPDQDAFRLALARLLKGAGRPREAYDALEAVAQRGGEGTVEALYELAVLDELGGAAEHALTRYDAILQRDAEQIWARCQRAAVLRHTLRRYDRAGEALEDVRTALGRLPAGPDRDRLRGWLDAEEEDLRLAREGRRTLGEADAHIRRALYGALGAWFVLLVGGGLLLRKRGLV